MCDCPALIDRLKRIVTRWRDVWPYLASSKKVVLQTAPRDAGFIDVFGDRVVTRQGGDFFPFAAGIQVARRPGA
jgi:hypothetical protein